MIRDFIKGESLKMNRRSFLKKFFGGIITFSIFSGGVYYYAKSIEPKRLKKTNHIIQSVNLPASFHRLKIIQFSDTHIGFHYHLTDFKDLIAKINAEKPDIIVFTGDLIDDPLTYKHTAELTNLLMLLEAPLGKYWVYGNHDHGGYGTETIFRIMEQSEFQLLKNSHKRIVKNGEQIALAGIDDVILGEPDVAEAIEGIENDLFTILLAHEPDYADVASQFPIDIQLSGHSHGGQVRLPIFGHLYTPAFAQKYIYGKYAFNDKPFTLYVNQGIGTTRMPFRFFCTPELSVYTFKHK